MGAILKKNVCKKKLSKKSGIQKKGKNG